MNAGRSPAPVGRGQSPRRGSRWTVVAATLLVTSSAATAATGCTQVAVLKPVAGDALTSVSNATSDVLTSGGVEVMTWPVCSFADAVYTCRGQTVAGESILGTAPAATPLQLTVKVGERTLYQGPLQAVLDQAGRVAP